MVAKHSPGAVVAGSKEARSYRNCEIDERPMTLWKMAVLCTVCTYVTGILVRSVYGYVGTYLLSAAVHNMYIIKK